MRKIFDVRKLVDRIAALIVAREAEGKGYGVVLMAEGLAEFLPLEEIHKTLSEDEYHSLKPDSFGHFPVSQLKYSSRLGRLVSTEYKKRTGKDKKVNGLQFGYEVPLPHPDGLRCRSRQPTRRGRLPRLGRKGHERRHGLRQRPARPRVPEVRRADQLRHPPCPPRPIEPGEDFHQLAGTWKLGCPSSRCGCRADPWKSQERPSHTPGRSCCAILCPCFRFLGTGIARPVTSRPQAVFGHSRFSCLICACGTEKAVLVTPIPTRRRAFQIHPT